MEFKIDIGVENREFIGICYGLLALACYAGFILVNRIINPNVHIYTRTLWQLLTGSLILIPFIMSTIHEVSISDIPWLIAVGFLPGFLAILFAVTALSRLPVAVSGTIAYFEPVSVVIFGWTIFDEILNPIQISGCLLIIMSGIMKTMATARPA